jgi:hypothetical protein
LHFRDLLIAGHHQVSGHLAQIVRDLRPTLAQDDRITFIDAAASQSRIVADLRA